MANENENIQNSQVADDTLLDFYPRFSNFVALYRGITRTWIDEQGVLWAEFVDGSTQEIGPVASYYYAVQSGYTGTTEEWVALLLSVSDNAESAAASASAASQSEAAASQSATSASASASTAEQWATGNTGGTPTATNNSKYYSEQAAQSASNAATSSQAAASSASAAATSESNAQQYASNASGSAQAAAQSAAQIANLKGAPNGLAELDSSGLVPSSQLPSYVDDVLEYQDEAHFPVAGESGKIYIDLSTNKSYRWSGSTYVAIASDLALGETSSTAYRGDRGKAAYDAAVVNVDSMPTTNSTHLITSGGVKAALPGTMTGATSSAAGTSGLVPQPSAGDEGKVLKGNGTWGDVDALPVVTLSDNGKVLEVINGEWDVGEKKIDEKYNIPFSSNWSTKEWAGLTDASGYYIWTDGENVYYSYESDHYVLDKSTSTWTLKTWTGLTDFYGYYVWTDGENVYYSDGSDQYVLDKSTSTWSSKTWEGLSYFRADYIWNDGENIYYSEGNDHYVLDKSTSTWTLKTWTGIIGSYGFYGDCIWTDGENVYYSEGIDHYVLDKSTSTWLSKTWTGLTDFNGLYIWTDGENVYYSDFEDHYVLDKSTSTWSLKTWEGLTYFNGYYIWNDGENVYYSDGSDQYALDKDNSSKLLLGTNGQFNAVSVEEVIPDMIGASDSIAGAHGLVPAPSAGDEAKFLKGDGTWDDVDALPVITSSDNGKVLEVNNGEWIVGDEKINKNYNNGNYVWNSKTWEGLTNFNGDKIWTDGENIYYSNNATQYILNKSTSTWSENTWTGLTSFSGGNIWTDGTNIYYSDGSTQFVLDVPNSVWSAKTWEGLTNFYGNYIWTDGENIYYSDYSTNYILDKSTSTWSIKQWTGLTSFLANYIWSDGENTYYSNGSTQYVLDKSTSTWNTKTWTGITNLYGQRVWSDGVNIYYSYSSTQRVLDKSTSTWNVKTWNGLSSFNGQYIWIDDGKIYYSYGTTQYESDYVYFNTLLLGTDGEFNAVPIEQVLPSDMTGATVSENGIHGLVPAPLIADKEKFLKGDGTWGNELPIATLSDERKVLQVSSNGEWITGSEKIDKNYEVINWFSKTWTGVIPNGINVWSDGDNVYYSYSSNQYILDKSTSTWTTKTWTGLTSFSGSNIWTDGENIYYSNNSNQYVLDKTTSTWTAKTWTGATGLLGSCIWTDGENVYYSNNSNQYILDKSTSTWSAKTWTGLTNFNGEYVWTDGNNIYFSNGSAEYVEEEYYGNGSISYIPGTQYILDKATSTWTANTWTGLPNLYATSIWTDGNNIYHSYGSEQHVLDKSTSTWSVKTWTVLTNFYGSNIWSDGENIYYSNGSSNQYVLNKNEPNKILLGSNGEFTVVNIDEVIPDISNKADLVDGKVPANELPSYVDDVLEYSSISEFPAEGESGKIYVDTTTNITYRWSGSTYVAIGSDLALGETSSTAYRGDRGAAAYAAAVTNVDSTPTTGSTNLITSGGVKAAIPDVSGFAPKSYPVFTGNISLGRKTNSMAGLQSVAIGYNVNASGSRSQAFGYASSATDAYAHAEGGGTTASGESSHSEGEGTTASGARSHAEGFYATASGVTSHAEGNYTVALGDYSHSEGYYSQANSQYSHAEGNNTKANAIVSHAEGYYTIADGSYSHVSGQYNVADSYANWNEWVAGTSYVVGDKVKVTTTSGGTTVVRGYICTTANSDSTFTDSNWENQIKKMNYAEIVGNGISDNERSNARVLDWEGNERIKGDLYVGCNSDSTGGTKVAKVSELPGTMTGATSSAAGTSGLVPTPSAGDEEKFLKGDGTWGEVNTSSSTVSKVSFTIATTDWTQSSNTYVADVTDNHITSTTEELIMYTNSVKNLTSDIDTNKDGTNNKITFIVNSVPTGSISGSIYIISQGNIVADTKVNIDQGVENAGKFLVVNSQGNVEPVTMQAWQGGSY